jgi:hypothetical protein
VTDGGDQLLASLQPCSSYPLNIERVTAITDEKTISGEANRARYSPMKPKTSTLALKSDEPPVLIPIEQQIQQRAYELYEQRGRTDGHDLDDWLQAECEIKGTQANAATA